MGNLPAALPPHGTVLAWALGCRREECECAYQRLASELALRCDDGQPDLPSGGHAELPSGGQLDYLV